MNTDDVENGKRIVEQLLRDEAAKKGVELTSGSWREISPTIYQLEVAAASGKKTYRDFKREHLAGADTKKYHWLVRIKILGTVARLA
jgi:hypothetical protein